MWTQPVNVDIGINMECDDQATRPIENLSQPLWILSGIQCETHFREFPNSVRTTHRIFPTFECNYSSFFIFFWWNNFGNLVWCLFGAFWWRKKYAGVIWQKKKSFCVKKTLENGCGRTLELPWDVMHSFPSSEHTQDIIKTLNKCNVIIMGFIPLTFNQNIMFMERGQKEKLGLFLVRSTKVADVRRR